MDKKILVFCLIIIFIFIFNFNFAFAIIPFGGTILKTVPCLNGLLLIVGPPRGGPYLFTLGSILYLNYSLKEGSWVLGVAVPGGICILPFGAIPAFNIIRVGAS